MRIDDQGHGTSLYHYDLLDRLRVVEGPTPEAFLFDPASNLLEALEGQEATDAQESRALPEPTSPNARRPQQTPGNRLKRQGNRRFNYDARGNRTEEIIERGARQGQVTRYSYNAQNQLVEVRTGVGANANTNATTTRYAYDALGRRISKTSQHDEQQNTTTFYWNGDVLLGEINSNTKPSRTYLFEPFSFKPLALIQNSEVFHYHTDHIGTPREITNARAEVVWSSTFKTYGALALAHVNEVDNPLRFQGQYHDEETGLHYNRHRYYDPNCGQFTTQDPIGLLGGMNAYQYAPNPMTWVDPWGLLCKEGSDRVKRNVDESRRARESSRFNEYSDREWPPNRGFESTPEPKVLMPGERIDRYGSPYGTYTSPEGTPYRARAPKPGTDLKPYSVYEITQPIEVRSGSAKPWFGYEGGGMQYEMPQSMKDLEAAGKIKRVN